jgi:hypothetical protein
MRQMRKYTMPPPKKPMNQAAWKHFSHPGASFAPPIATTNPAKIR